MRKVLVIFLSLVYFTLTQSSAAVYKGQNYYVKNCVKCHDGGQAFISDYTMVQWKKWMSKKGILLATMHLQNEKAENSHKYFESKAFLKQSQHLKQFLIEYAKDSGNVAACN